MMKSKVENFIARFGRNTQAYTGGSTENFAIVFNAKKGQYKHDLEKGIKDLIELLFAGGNYTPKQRANPVYTTAEAIFCYEGEIPDINPLKVKITTFQNNLEYSLGLITMFPISIAPNQNDFDKKNDMILRRGYNTMIEYAERFADTNSLSIQKAIDFAQKQSDILCAR